MRYKGGKNGSGVYQRLISLIPPHRLYVEAFLGSGAIMRRKRPAEKQIAFELDRKAIHEFCRSAPAEAFAFDLAEWPTPADPLPHCGQTSIVLYPSGLDANGNKDYSTKLEIYNADAFEGLRSKFLASSAFWGFNDPGEVFIYLDPPYPDSVRSSPGKIYEFELMAEQEHAELLDLILKIPCRLMISGYDNELYNSKLKGWRKVEIPTTNRAGARVIETVWLNFPEPFELHDYQFAGENYRDRWRIEKRRRNWAAQIRGMLAADRSVLLHDIGELKNEYHEAETARQSAFTKKAIARALKAERVPKRETKSAVTPEPELFDGKSYCSVCHEIHEGKHEDEPAPAKRKRII